MLKNYKDSETESYLTDDITQHKMELTIQILSAN